MAKSIHEVIADELGILPRFEENPEAVDVDSTEKIILRANPNRFAVLFVNLGTVAIFLRPQRTATLTSGFQLAAGGGSLFINWREDLVLPALEWHAIASIDNQTLEIWSVEGEADGEV